MRCQWNSRLLLMTTSVRGLKTQEVATTGAMVNTDTSRTIDKKCLTVLYLDARRHGLLQHNIVHPMEQEARICVYKLAAETTLQFIHPLWITLDQCAAYKQGQTP